jgi:hypothetical protein
MIDDPTVEHVRDEITREVCGDDRPNVWVIDVNHIRVCRTCGALVPIYAVAFHMNWHEKRLP